MVDNGELRADPDFQAVGRGSDSRLPLQFSYTYKELKEDELYVNGVTEKTLLRKCLIPEE